MYGKGENVRDWLYVEDHCRALDFVLNKGKIGETYNIGGGEEKTNYEIVHKNELAAKGGLIKRDSVNSSTLDMLEYINEHGDLPMSNAKNRRK